MKQAPFFSLSYCLTITVYLTVSLPFFDTIVKNDMLWDSPEIKAVPPLAGFTKCPLAQIKALNFLGNNSDCDLTNDWKKQLHTSELQEIAD